MEPKFSFGGPAVDSSKPSTPSTFSWGKQQTGWSCKECLVQNKEDVIKCVACEAVKPGAVVADKVEPKYSFGSSTNVAEKVDTKFTFGSASIVAEGPKYSIGDLKTPGKSFEMPKFTFGTASKNDLNSSWKCNECLVENKIQVDKCLTCEAKRPAETPMKPAFVFGQSATPGFGAPSSTGFSFGF